MFDSWLPWLRILNCSSESCRAGFRLHQSMNRDVCHGTRIVCSVTEGRKSIKRKGGEM